MKLKALATTIVAGGLLAAAGPSLAVTCSTVSTIAGWAALGAAGCTDNTDGDTTWVFVSATVPLTSAFSVTEIPFTGGDLYNVAFDFGIPQGTGSVGESVSYTATGTAAEPFDAANFDSNVTQGQGVSGNVATGHITAAGGVDVMLTSTNGGHAPPTGETSFANSLTINVTDTLVTIPQGSVFNAMNNSFQTGTVGGKIPEPATLLLLGAALAGAGFARRRKQD